MRIPNSAKRKARDYWARRLVHSPHDGKAGQLLWRAGIAGTIAAAFLNICIQWFGYGSKGWVTTPATTALFLLTVVFMGAAIVGSILRSHGGGRG